MPSVKNPNKPSKNRLAARASKAKKRAQKASAIGTRAVRFAISNSDAQRGAKPGLLPTSGPNAALSKKKAKKMEQRRRLLKRKMEEVEGTLGQGEERGEEVDMDGEFFFFFLAFGSRAAGWSFVGIQVMWDGLTRVDASVERGKAVDKEVEMDVE